MFRVLPNLLRLQAASHLSFLREAYLDDALSCRYSLVDAIHAAAVAIRAKQRQQGLPPSQPQISSWCVHSPQAGGLGATP